MSQENTQKRSIFVNVAVVIALIFLLVNVEQFLRQKQTDPTLPRGFYGTQPLVMKGGDPYIRALMRTITASEANDPRPYSLIYGGSRAKDLSKHPSICITIQVGPNKGNCSTAAGRYQFLNTTWRKQAERYNSKTNGFLWGRTYSFEPIYQDRVVHDWLSDPQAWGVNISQLLRQGQIEEVLRLLSGTWTSLGYGIETNSMSRHLPTIYKKMLQEELR